jgi:4-hydroxy-2-oxoheptanedioate aldolase
MLVPVVLLVALGLAFADRRVEAQTRARWSPMAELLDRGQVVFGTFVGNTSADGGAEALRSEADWLLYDMEHSPFDVAALRIFMQFLLDPADIARNGSPARHKPLLVRIPANGREMNQWMVKNLLDQGVRGIVAPHIETAEQALNLVRAMRYPRKPGSPNVEPEGQRGSGAGNAARYWGVSGQEYRARAGLWPLDPEGEMFNVMLIENGRGVENARAIAKVPGLGILSAAPGDLGSFYEGDREAVEAAIQQVLAAGKEANVPCAITAGPNDVERRIKEGFRVIIGGAEMIRVGRKVAGR